MKTKSTATSSHFTIFSWSQRIALNSYSALPFAAECSYSDSLLSAIAMQRSTGNEVRRESK